MIIDPSAQPVLNARQIFENRTRLPFIPTWSAKMNKILGGGLRATGTYVLVGPPGSGKTTFTLSIVDAAIKQGYPVIYVSAELLPMLVLARYAAGKLGMGWLEIIDTEDPNKIANYQKFSASVSEFLWILDPEQSQQYKRHIIDIRAKLNEKFGYAVPVLIVVDYIQDLAQPRISRGKDHRTAVGEVSRELRLLANQEFCPLWMVSSTSRSFYTFGQDEEQSNELLLGSAKEAGEVEYNVNAVTYLRPRMVGDQPHTEAVIVKNRFGENPVSIMYGANPVTGEYWESAVNASDAKLADAIMKIYKMVEKNPGKFKQPIAIAKAVGLKKQDVAYALDALSMGMGGYKVSFGVGGVEAYYAHPFQPPEALT